MLKLKAAIGLKEKELAKVTSALPEEGEAVEEANEPSAEVLEQKAKAAALAAANQQQAQLWQNELVDTIESMRMEGAVKAAIQQASGNQMKQISNVTSAFNFTLGDFDAFLQVVTNAQLSDGRMSRFKDCDDELFALNIDRNERDSAYMNSFPLLRDAENILTVPYVDRHGLPLAVMVKKSLTSVLGYKQSQLQESTITLLSQFAYTIFLPTIKKLYDTVYLEKASGSPIRASLVTIARFIKDVVSIDRVRKYVPIDYLNYLRDMAFHPWICCSAAMIEGASLDSAGIIPYLSNFEQEQDVTNAAKKIEAKFEKMLAALEGQAAKFRVDTKLQSLPGSYCKMLAAHLAPVFTLKVQGAADLLEQFKQKMHDVFDKVNKANNYTNAQAEYTQGLKDLHKFYNNLTPADAKRAFVIGRNRQRYSYHQIIDALEGAWELLNSSVHLSEKQQIFSQNEVLSNLGFNLFDDRAEEFIRSNISDDGRYRTYELFDVAVREFFAHLLEKFSWNRSALSEKKKQAEFEREKAKHNQRLRERELKASDERYKERCNNINE